MTHFARNVQWELVRDEPLNWGIQVVESHNAYNNIADGYLFPNQRYSLSDQLDLGVRWLELDPNFIPTPLFTGTSGHLRVCHGKDDLHTGCGIWDRLVDNALKEIDAWLVAHPDEVIFIRLEDYFDATGCTHGQLDAFITLVNETFGDRIHVRTASDAFKPFPSRTEMLAMGKQVIILSDNNGGVGTLSPNPQQQESGDFFRDNATRPQCGDGFFLASGVNHHGELLDQDGQLVEYDVCGAICRLHVDVSGADIERTLVAGCDPALAAGACEKTPCAIPPGCGYDPTQLKDRNYLLEGEFGRVYESRVLVDVFGDIQGDTGLIALNESEVEQLSQCYVSIVGFDYVHAKEDTPRAVCDDQEISLNECRSPDQRLKAMVWSLADEEYGGNGDAFYVDASDGRWRSGDENVAQIAACGVKRRGAASGWSDKTGRDWELTQCPGSWVESGERCWREFGEDHEFVAPRNGWMNARLGAAMGEAGVSQAWVDLSDRSVEGQPVVNRPPVIEGAKTPAGDFHFEGSPILFAVTGANDPEGEALTFKWTFGDVARQDLCDLSDPPPSFGVATSHTYGDNGPLPESLWPTTLLAIDGGGAVDVFNLPVTVLNVAPTTVFESFVDETGDTIGVDVPVAYVGLPTRLFGSFTDPGWLDTHTGTVSWGEGQISDVTVEQFEGSGNVTDEHTYWVPGNFMVTLTITDDDGGVHAVTVPIEVLDAAGALGYVAEALANDPDAAACCEVVERRDCSARKGQCRQRHRPHRESPCGDGRRGGWDPRPA